MDAVLLKSVPLFSSMSDEQLRLLHPCLQHRRYSRGDYILREGEQTNALYLIVSGRVKILIKDKQGREVILAFLGKNDFFGEMGLLDGQPSSASVETIEPCHMLQLSKAGFLAALQKNFELAMVIVNNLVKRLRVALIDVYGRVARLLMDESELVNGSSVVFNPPSKQEIARIIGASREMVTRVMKDLQLRGCIRLEKRKIFILDQFSINKSVSDI
jgi:CRP/FNR family cyclic AMP-dependent transcriptional regulator